MRPAFQGKYISVVNSQLQAINIGYDYCAEHEAGSANIKRIMGCVVDPDERAMSSASPDDTFTFITGVDDFIIKNKEAFFGVKLNVPAGRKKKSIWKPEQQLEDLAAQHGFKNKKSTVVAILSSKVIDRYAISQFLNESEDHELPTKEVSAYDYYDMPESEIKERIEKGWCKETIVLHLPFKEEKDGQFFVPSNEKFEKFLLNNVIKLSTEEFRKVQLAEFLMEKGVPLPEKLYIGCKKNDEDPNFYHFTSEWMSPFNQGDTEVPMRLVGYSRSMEWVFSEMLRQLNEGKLTVSMPNTGNPFSRGGLQFCNIDMVSEEQREEVKQQFAAYRKTWENLIKQGTPKQFDTLFGGKDWNNRMKLSVLEYNDEGVVSVYWVDGNVSGKRVFGRVDPAKIEQAIQSQSKEELVAFLSK